MGVNEGIYLMVVVHHDLDKGRLNIFLFLREHEFF